MWRPGGMLGRIQALPGTGRMRSRTPGANRVVPARSPDRGPATYQRRIGTCGAVIFVALFEQS